MSARPNSVVDLRSDVVTQPTAAMRTAMEQAAVGSYTIGDNDEDPTVKELEALLADRFAKEAALFMPSVTMANLVACMHYCNPGDQVLVDQDSHIYRHELSGMARIAGVMPRVIERVGALPDSAAVEGVLRGRHIEPPIGLLWIENTHTDGGGAVADIEGLEALRKIGQHAGVPLHMDGARIFNAAVALNMSVARIAATVDSVSISFVKGLGCPIGSALVGSNDLIQRALPLRRMLGGMWLKAGVVAAPCIVALNTMVARLAEDHEAADEIGRVIQGMPQLRLSCPVVTNQLRVDTVAFGAATTVRDLLLERRISVGVPGPTLIRMVTHLGVGPEEVRQVCDALNEIVAIRIT